MDIKRLHTHILICAAMGIFACLPSPLLAQTQTDSSGQEVVEPDQTADAGEREARLALARALLEGDGDEEDPVQARQILIDLALENSAAAQLGGDLARDGIGGPTDGTEAAHLYRLAGEAGRDTAWLRLGALLNSGEEIARDPEGALDAYERAAAGTHAGSAARARIALLRGHVRGDFAAQSDPSRIADLATEPLYNGNVGVARLIVTDASDMVPAEMLSQALDILNTAANDGDQGSARTLFSYWMRERATRPAIAETELNRIVAEHSELLTEASILTFKLDSGQAAPAAFAELAADPLDAGNFGVARLVVSRASDMVPAEMLSQALDILNTAANDGDQGSARTLFSYWMRERATRPAIAETELNRIVAEHSELLTEASILRLKIDRLAPSSRSSSQFQALSGLLLNASGDELPTALVSIRRHNVNAYVHALQSLLEKHGFYSGPKNGLLTRNTITSISRLCASGGISRECALGPMRGPVARSIGTVFAGLQ